MSRAFSTYMSDTAYLWQGHHGMRVSRYGRTEDYLTGTPECERLRAIFFLCGKDAWGYVELTSAEIEAQLWEGEW